MKFRQKLGFGSVVLTSVLFGVGNNTAYARQLNQQEINQVISNAHTNTGNLHAEITQDLIRNIIRAESNGRDDATSRVGARGLMQIMRRTWQDMTTESFDRAYDGQTNANVGVRYLNWIVNYCSRNNPNWQNLSTQDRQRQIAAAYNGGIGRLRRNNWDITRMPQETRNYVNRVVGN